MQLNNDGLMWALVKEKPEEGLWMKRVPIPEVGPNDVKIKIHKTAICGTDVHIYQWNDWAQHTIPIGLTAGHEYVGEIVEKGEGVQGFKSLISLFIFTSINYRSSPLFCFFVFCGFSFGTSIPANLQCSATPSGSNSASLARSNATF